MQERQEGYVWKLSTTTGIAVSVLNVDVSNDAL